MSDCVYFGFRDAMHYYGLQIHPSSHAIFSSLKAATLPPARPWSWEDGWTSTYTYGGVAPWILKSLANLHGLEIVVQHRLWTPEHYTKQAETHWQAAISTSTAYLFGKEVDAIDLEPAIYLMLDGPISLHAQFFEQVPVDKGVCVMAIALANPVPTGQASI